MSAQLVRKAWKRIEAWCRVHGPQDLKGFNPGASRKEIRALEAAIKRPLPEDVRTWLSIHNGQSVRARDFLFDHLRLLPCEQIAKVHSEYSGSFLCELSAEERDFHFYPPDAIAHHHFNGGWIPIANFGSEYLAVDLSPGPSGTAGQVIDFGKHIRNPGVMAVSWGEFLYSYADLLDNLLEITPEPENSPDPMFEPLLEMCESNWLDGIVLWARDGWWPIVRFDPTWRTPTVLALARTISETYDFSAMPILADALQDAGCEAPAVLKHCRDRECTHFKGCWVINTLLSGAMTKQRNCHQFGR